MHPGINVIKLFCQLFTNSCNKLVCLSVESHYSLVLCLWVRPGAFPRVEHLKEASLGQSQPLPQNAPGANVTKLFFPLFTNSCNKLVCWSTTSHYSLVLCLWIRPGAFPRVKHLRCFTGVGPASPANIRLGWKGSPGML